jgi:hypothetical protein
MYASSMHGNREIPEAAGAVPASVRSGKAAGPTPDVYATGKSDEDIVSRKPSNNGAQLGDSGHPPAETVERRSSAKGNPGQPTVTGTQRPAAASSGLDRVREAVRRDLKAGGPRPWWGRYKVQWFSPVLADVYLHYVLDLWVHCAPVPKISASASDPRQEPYEVIPHVRICAGGGP